jgi:hypothetical protein
MGSVLFGEVRITQDRENGLNGAYLFLGNVLHHDALP